MEKKTLHGFLIFFFSSVTLIMTAFLSIPVLFQAILYQFIFLLPSTINVTIAHFFLDHILQIQLFIPWKNQNFSQKNCQKIYSAFIQINICSNFATTPISPCSGQSAWFFHRFLIKSLQIFFLSHWIFDYWYMNYDISF